MRENEFVSKMKKLFFHNNIISLKYRMSSGHFSFHVARLRSKMNCSIMDLFFTRSFPFCIRPNEDALLNRELNRESTTSSEVNSATDAGFMRKGCFIGVFVANVQDSDSISGAVNRFQGLAVWQTIETETETEFHARVSTSGRATAHLRIFQALRQTESVFLCLWPGYLAIFLAAASVHSVFPSENKLLYVCVYILLWVEMAVASIKTILSCIEIFCCYLCPRDHIRICYDCFVLLKTTTLYAHILFIPLHRLVVL